MEKKEKKASSEKSNSASESLKKKDSSIRIKPNLDLNYSNLLRQYNTQKAELENLREKIIQTRRSNKLKVHDDELHVNEQILKSLFNAIVESVCLINNSGKLLALNETFAKRLGKSIDDCIGKSIYSLIPENIATFRKSIIEKVIRTSQPTIFEDERDGIWLRHSIVPVLNDAEKVDRIAIYAIDITETRRLNNTYLARIELLKFADNNSLDLLLEETLNKAEELTGSLIGFYHFLEEDQTTLWLQNWSRRTKNEFCKAEGKGSHYDIALAGVWVDCVHQRKPVIHNDYESLEHKKGLPPGHAHVTREMVVPVIRSGKIMAILGVGNKPTNYTDKDVEIVALLADLAWDITVRKRAEEKLLKNEQMLSTIYDSIGDIIYHLGVEPNGKYRFISINQAFIKATGLKQEQIIGKLVNEVIPEPSLTLVLKKYKQAISEKQIVVWEETSTYPSGTVTGIVSIAPVYDSKGNCINLVGSVHDITKRKNAEELLKSKSAILEAQTNATIDGILIVNEHRKRVLINKRTLELFKPPKHIVESDDDNLLLHHVVAMSKNPEQFLQKVEYLFNHPNETSQDEVELRSGITLDRYSAPVIGKDGQYYGRIWTFRDITERKKTETALRKSQILLTASIESQKDTIVLSIDRNYKYLYFNKAHYDSMKLVYNSDIKVGMNILECITSNEDRKAAKENYDRALNGESHSNIRQYGDFEHIYYESFFNPIVDDNNDIIGATALAINISERKKADEKLEESERFLRETQIIAKLGTYTLDLSTGIWNSSDILDVIFGIDKNYDKSVNGWISIIHPEWQKTMNDYLIQEVIGKKQKFDKEYKIIRPSDMQERWVYGIGSLKFDDKNQPFEMVGTIQDITERKQIEELLRIASHYSRSLIEASLDPLVTIDANGKITDVNSATENVTGLDRNILIGTDFSNYFTEPEKANAGYRKVFEQGFVIDYPLTIRHSSGNEIHVLYNASIFKDEHEKTLGVFAAARDITARREVEEKLKANEKILKELNADKDRFMSILAHDLRSPFNSLLGLSEILSKNIHKYDIFKIESLAKNINRTAQSSFNLLDNLLMWTRSQSGKIPFDPKLVKFASICTEILEVFKPIAYEKSITINYFSADDITIFADVDMLKTVLRNLISNAIKFSNHGGRINVYAEEYQFKITITVSDSGIGISQEIAPKLFNNYHGHSTKGTANESGTGLGLLLCKEFIEKHSGKIWVESEKGLGSEFKFTLPKSL